MKKLPVHSARFGPYGPQLFFEDIPYGFGYEPFGDCDDIAYEMEAYGTWDDGCLIQRYITPAQLEEKLGQVKCVVLGPAGEFLFGLYGEAEIEDPRYDPRKIRKVMEVSQDEYDRNY